MKINNAKKWVPFSLPHRLFMTLLIISGVFILRYFLHAFLGGRHAFLPFLVAAQLIAYFYGYQFGLFSIVLGAGLAAYYFVPPYGAFTTLTRGDLIMLVGIFIAAVVSIILIEHLRRSRYSNRLLLMLSQSRYNCLLRLDNHRLHLQRRATRARHDLSDLLEQFGLVIFLQLPGGEVCLQNKFYELTGTTHGTDALNWHDFIDAADRQRIEALLQSEQPGRFIKHRLPVHFLDASGDRKLIDCIVQTFPLDSGKTAMALRLERRTKPR
jgi:K+-sensing histidine kinase KdpD